MGILLMISAVSATDNTTQNDNTLTLSEEPVSVENNTLNPKVIIGKDGNYGINFGAPDDIYDGLSLYVNNVSYGKYCELENNYGIIKENVTVKNSKGEIVATKHISWSNLKVTLNGKTVTLSDSDYQLLKQHKTVKKYVGIKKTKYVSKYKWVTNTYYKSKFLGKAYKSAVSKAIVAKVYGIKNAIKYFKYVDKRLSRQVNNQINIMKKKGWKLEYTYRITCNGVYKVYGEFYKVKKVKTPVYKYKKYKNYMVFKYSSGKYVASVDSNDNKYTYSKTFKLI